MMGRVEGGHLTVPEVRESQRDEMALLSDHPAETLLPHLQNGHNTYLHLMGWQEGISELGYGHMDSLTGKPEGSAETPRPQALYLLL